MQKIQSEIRRVDAGILAAVRQQVINISYSFMQCICFIGFASHPCENQMSREFIKHFN